MAPRRGGGGDACHYQGVIAELHSQNVYRVEQQEKNLAPENVDPLDCTACEIHFTHTGGDVPGFANVCGILLPTREQTETADKLHQGPLVVTPTVRRNMEAAAMALCQKRPLLLEGPPGEKEGSFPL